MKNTPKTHRFSGSPLALSQLVRFDIEDVVDAHVRAVQNGSEIGFGRYIISATTPFTAEDLAEVRTDAPSVVGRYVPRYREVYRKHGWSMFPGIDRVYVNERARRELGWQPDNHFARILDLIEAHGTANSLLAEIVGVKGYHAQTFLDGPYPVSNSCDIAFISFRQGWTHERRG